MKKKGVYCIEGLWSPHDMKDKSTVLPILDLLHKHGECDYIYHDCATKSELAFFLEKWTRKSICEKYPILYLAFHGKEECIQLDGGSVTLDELGEFLEDKCYQKVIYFASCSTFHTDGRKIQTFLSRTNALAAIGYKVDVDWLRSTALELIVLSELQEDKFDSKGMEKISEKIFADYGKLNKLMELRIETNKRMHFARKRLT